MAKDKAKGVLNTSKYSADAKGVLHSQSVGGLYEKTVVRLENDTIATQTKLGRRKKEEQFELREDGQHHRIAKHQENSRGTRDVRYAKDGSKQISQRSTATKGFGRFARDYDVDARGNETTRYLRDGYFQKELTRPDAQGKQTRTVKLGSLYTSRQDIDRNGERTTTGSKVLAYSKFTDKQADGSEKTVRRLRGIFKDTTVQNAQSGQLMKSRSILGGLIRTQRVLPATHVNAPAPSIRPSLSPIAPTPAIPVNLSRQLAARAAEDLLRQPDGGLKVAPNRLLPSTPVKEVSEPSSHFSISSAGSSLRESNDFRSYNEASLASLTVSGRTIDTGRLSEESAISCGSWRIDASTYTALTGETPPRERALPASEIVTPGDDHDSGYGSAVSDETRGSMEIPVMLDQIERSGTPVAVLDGNRETQRGVEQAHSRPVSSISAASVADRTDRVSMMSDVEDLAAAYADDTNGLTDAVDEALIAELEAEAGPVSRVYDERDRSGHGR